MGRRGIRAREDTPEEAAAKEAAKVAAEQAVLSERSKRIRRIYMTMDDLTSAELLEVSAAVGRGESDNQIVVSILEARGSAVHNLTQSKGDTQ